MRIVFMGTPDFAVASLRRLVEDGHEICGVFTQPDKPKNRGMKMTFSPVKEYALSQNLEVYQPLKMRDGEALGILQALKPELIVVAAYGRILPEDILNECRQLIENGAKDSGTSQIRLHQCAFFRSAQVPRCCTHQLGDHQR